MVVSAMGTVKQTVIFAAALAGGITASQMPEFGQQYRQRIGGAIEELGRIVAEFDRDASKNGLTRDQALVLHERAPEPLFRDRGESMRGSIGRLDTLVRQRADFETRSPLLQPLVLANSDAATFDGTFKDFQPAVPLTAAGLAWGAAGFAAAALIVYLLGGVLGWCWRSLFRRSEGRVQGEQVR